MRQDLSIAIVKPVGARCNLDCSYCFVRHQSVSRVATVVMDRPTLSSLTRFFCTLHDQVSFIWHGGEPLLAGLEFYSHALEVQRPWVRAGKQIHNSIQTNATLIDERWAAFFAENCFLVGVSLDGPPDAHDTFRTYRSGSGSFRDVRKGISHLQEKGIFSGIICCVSSANVSRANELLDYLVKNGLKSLKFNRIRGSDAHGNPLPGAVSACDYARFLLAIFKKWVALDDPDIEVREINSIVSLLLGGDLRECVFCGSCQRFGTVLSNGAIYPCDCLPVRDCFQFGFVTDEPSGVLDSPGFQKFVAYADRARRACSSCEWFALCRGGCLQDWVRDGSSGSFRNAACEGLKGVFAGIERELQRYGLV